MGVEPAAGALTTRGVRGIDKVDNILAVGVLAHDRDTVTMHGLYSILDGHDAHDAAAQRFRIPMRPQASSILAIFDKASSWRQYTATINAILQNRRESPLPPN